MIAHLILLSLYCALGKTDDAHYSETLVSITEAKALLNESVLSMDGNIPLLDDPRRHYAQIVHVVNQVAILQSACVHLPYNKDYSRNLEKFEAEALGNPRVVISETRKLIKSFDEAAGVIQTLIKTFNGNDSMVDAIVKADPKKYSQPAKVFFTAGYAANEYYLKHYDFDHESQNFSVQLFLQYGAKRLKSLVLALANLHRQLHRVACK